MKKKTKKSILEKLEPIFFPVTKTRAENYLSKEGISFLPGLDTLIVVETKPGQKTVVNTCSSNYELVSNRELLTPIVKRLEEEHELDVRYHSFHGSVFCIDLIIMDKAFNIGRKMKKDDLMAKVAINNSYDSTLPFSWSAGIHRCVCDNGLTRPVDGSSYGGGGLHTPGLKHREVGEAVNEFMDNMHEIIAGYDPLFGQGYSLTDAIKRMAEVQEEITEYPKKALETAAAQLQREANEGFKVDDWLIYNAMNFALHNTPDSKLITPKANKIDAKVLSHLISF